ncbi:dual specificity protein kinase TTK isoform X1 [Dromaius novaehollandiae]|uniref:Dual specificity protein kinase TTK n=4 Tax=Dromaius novaehollandiae TaxID=8790 RepID=A0A8C4KMP9_DRONO|nr:dual specificity protein kinase TTK [Dromaius novaehollandiae]XP_025976872.1 dual specificity protein kinase TTK [Dromaius novaehollandiae]XP_025976873.1 dual specificity protein kinase TTK [Dromaius novaehollandiae]XP_025976874.1 dual specificity protein kinase TTK [Dromaius novaehollandiae]XP_025976875.1 dual specificity protein kinase TTK [Dromaius novaehollandiae]XP_025976876.1 dual specificity protein kinase TTK [Dromaius novaehollandiae]XP_025976878.1 dual specificity protein kinase 
MEEDLSERGLPQIASIMSRVRDLKNKYKNEDNVTDELNYTKISADTTDNSGTVNQIMMTTNNPEDWLSFLLRIEKKGIPQVDVTLLNRLIGRYSQAVTALPAEKHSQDESYARILVRFAELKALQDPEEARDQFHLARLNCKKFAFVHVAFAQFELSQGNMKKCKQLLQKAVDCCAVPLEMLETALKNFHSQKKQLLSDEEKENFAVSSTQASGLQNIVGNHKSRKRNDSENSSTATLGGEKLQEFDALLNCHNPLRPLNKSNQACPFGRVPVKLIADTADTVKKVDIPLTASVMKRQISSLKSTALIVPFPLSEPKSSGDDSYDLGDLKSLEDRNSIQLQMLDEDSLETATSSTVTLKTKVDASLATKREENRVQYQELKIPEPRCLESQQQQSSSAEGYRKQIDRIKLSCVNSRRKWPVQEVAQKSCYKEGKQSSFEQPSYPISKGLSPPDAVSKKSDLLRFCGTPSTTFNDYMDCFRTPVVKNDFPPGCQISTPYSQLPYFLPHTPATPFQNQIGLQVSASISSNECLAIKGKVYTILKQIGSGGSSKVFQVLNEKKQLYAVKYVNLEEADKQTIESYKNEISHLSKLQQHSDKIIRLYGYEITENHIYMVMECGNIDLNSWLKKKKNIDPLERKSYWKNMLEAVHTIHEYGIIHSDLKPANFLIVDGMLKLIDFGIANQMQPDVTSIVKDSQVGTMNYMPPEAIKDMSSYGENETSRSKISPKSDVWSLGCILYCMTYGRTPFQHITNPVNKLHAIIDPSYEIEFPDIAERDLQDVLKCCLIRNPKQRISVSELLIHPYVQIQTHSQTGVPNAKGTTEEMKRILGQLVGLNSPNSISRAARTLYEQCNSGKSLDVSAFAKIGNQKSRTTK